MADLFKIILIETHNQCNRKCWFCKFGQIRQDPRKTRMPLRTVERIIENLRDLGYEGRVSWFWINEPLIDKRIFDILALTRKSLPNAYISLITNGDVLTKNIYRKLRYCGLDALGVSIYDDKTFHKINKMKKDSRLVMLDQRNPWLVNQAGNVKQHPDYFKKRILRHTYASCARPFEMMVVNADGKVALCCSDLYTDVEMGDVMDSRLEEIWQNDVFQHYRVSLNKTGRKGLMLCDGCSHPGAPSNMFYPLLDKPKPSFVKETVKRLLKLGFK